MSIDPPESSPTPKWARTLLSAARARNLARRSSHEYTIADLVAAWNACGGRCAISGRPFDFRVVGDGQAKRPFAPSLDRIDCNAGYHRGNVRLVLAIANFAMNAWGLEPLRELATGVFSRHGDVAPSAVPARSDAELDEIAAIDSELVETELGIVAFPPRLDLHMPLLDFLRNGSKSSRAIESALADRFGVTPEARATRLRNGSSAWRNHVAWVLVDLGVHKQGTGNIERMENRRAPDGGSMGIYRLTNRPLSVPLAQGSTDG